MLDHGRAAVALSAPPCGPTKLLSSSIRGCCWLSTHQPGRWWWWLLAARQLMATRWSGCRSSSPPPRHPSMQSSSSLLVVFNCMATNKADLMRQWSMPHYWCLSGSRQSLPFFNLAPLPTNDAAPPTANEVSPLSPTSCHHCRCACQGTLGQHHAVPSLQGRATTITTICGTWSPFPKCHEVSQPVIQLRSTMQTNEGWDAGFFFTHLV